MARRWSIAAYASAALARGSVRSNDVFEFTLSADEMTRMDDLDTGRRGGPEPDAITLEDFGRAIPEA
jgi:hypothetical protein